MGIIFRSVPIASLTPFPSEKRLEYLGRAILLPNELQDILYSSRTGAYLRGVIKTFQLPPESSAVLAWHVLQITLGELPLSKFPVVLSSSLKLPNDRAQELALDVEKELFAPVMLQLNQYVSSLSERPRTTSGPSTQGSGARNVVDLKNLPPKQ